MYKNDDEDDEDEFYKKKKWSEITTNNIIDNRRIKYNKIPHHIKNEKNKEGIWADFYMSNWLNKNNNINGLRLKEMRSNYNWIFNTNRSNMHKFGRKINTSVLPPNPFDSVTEAREYFFFNDE